MNSVLQSDLNIRRILRYLDNLRCIEELLQLTGRQPFQRMHLLRLQIRLTGTQKDLALTVCPGVGCDIVRNLLNVRAVVMAQMVARSPPEPEKRSSSPNISSYLCVGHCQFDCNNLKHIL